MKYAALLLLCGLLAGSESKSAQSIFDRAVQALSRGDYSIAEEGFKAVLALQPNNVGAIGDLGILYARTNRIDKAIEEHERALRLSPDDEAILLNLGIVYLKEEAHRRALRYFERVLAIDPQNRQASQLRDVCRLYTGQVLPAIADLKTLSEANPGDEQLLFLLGFAYLKGGDSTSAQEIFSQMLVIAGPARAQFLFGEASYEAALFPQAEQDFLEVLRLNSKLPGIHLEMGKVYISERRTDDAIRQLEEALNENPKDQEANYFLGCLLVRENHFEQGLHYLEEAKRLKPDSYGVYLYLGKAKLYLGHTAEAIALLQKAVELNPDDATAQYTLARALKSSGQEAAARKVFDRVRNLNDRAAVSETAIPGIR